MISKNCTQRKFATNILYYDTVLTFQKYLNLKKINIQFLNYN